MPWEARRRDLRFSRLFRPALKKRVVQAVDQPDRNERLIGQQHHRSAGLRRHGRPQPAPQRFRLALFRLRTDGLRPLRPPCSLPSAHRPPNSGHHPSWSPRKRDRASSACAVAKGRTPPRRLLRRPDSSLPSCCKKLLFMDIR